jgi:hypothetical protein
VVCSPLPLYWLHMDNKNGYKTRTCFLVYWVTSACCIKFKAMQLKAVHWHQLQYTLLITQLLSGHVISSTFKLLLYTNVIFNNANLNCKYFHHGNIHLIHINTNCVNAYSFFWFLPFVRCKHNATHLHTFDFTFAFNFHNISVFIIYWQEPVMLTEC